MAAVSAHPGGVEERFGVFEVETLSEEGNSSLLGRLCKAPVQCCEGQLQHPCRIEIFRVVCCKAKLTSGGNDTRQWWQLLVFFNSLGEHDLKGLQGLRCVGWSQNASPLGNDKSVRDFSSPKRRHYSAVACK